MAACSENLRPSLGADVRDICLRFSSKGDCNRSCTRSHVPLRGHNRELMIRYIRGAREAMNKLNNRKFDGVGDQRAHGGHWDRGINHGNWNTKAENGARFCD